jgi:transglutaminase-like putative cysteine protease/thiol-disulfide isomerase/thioredoxin
MRPDAHVLRRRFFLAIRRLAAILWIAALAGPCAGVLHAAEWLVVPAASPPGADDDALHALLASWKGRPVIINFWASWCEPCREEMPSLQRLARRQPPQGLAVATVAVADQRTTLDRFLAENAVQLPVVDDREQSISRAWGARVLPTTVILDRRHRIRLRAQGTIDWDSPAVEKQLQALFNPGRRTTMDRRHFIKTAALLGAGTFTGANAAVAATDGRFNPLPDNGWRVFEVSTRAEVLKTGSPTRVWLPLPSLDDPGWIRNMGNVWQGNAATAEVQRDATYGALMLAATWEANEATPVIEVTSRFAIRDRSIDLSRPGKVAPLDQATAKRYTSATQLLPTDGIVKKTSAEITRGAGSDVEMARAIYEWIVDNTARNPRTRGCGTGDIRAMLETGDLTGKCADLNALYVGLARAAGLPARDVYGIRVADSRFGYKSLGKSGDITRAQHCRAEVWLAGFGWVPVDPADVRKVVLEEKPGLVLADDVVVAARNKLFGAWEMNWLAFNVAHDLALPGSNGPRIAFLMYPQGENAAGRFDSLDPDNFRYKITSREIAA